MREGNVSMLMIISGGRSTELDDFEDIVGDSNVSGVLVVDARRSVGRDANGIGIFWRSEKDRVRWGSGGVEREVDSRIIGEREEDGDDCIDGLWWLPEEEEESVAIYSEKRTTRKGSVTSEETAIYTQSRLESDIKRTGQNWKRDVEQKLNGIH